MTNEKQVRRQFTKEFKIEAVELMMRTDKSAADIARDLGIRPELLYRWKSEYSINNDNSFVGSGKRLESDDQVRLRQLEKENRELQEERDILKKALGIFSKKTR
jgi:transposase